MFSHREIVMDVPNCHAQRRMKSQSPWYSVVKIKSDRNRKLETKKISNPTYPLHMKVSVNVIVLVLKSGFVLRQEDALCMYCFLGRFFECFCFKGTFFSLHVNAMPVIKAAIFF